MAKNDIVWHKLEDGLPELPTLNSILECLAFVPDGLGGGEVVLCDFEDRCEGAGAVFYKALWAPNRRAEDVPIEGMTHWALVQRPC